MPSLDALYLWDMCKRTMPCQSAQIKVKIIMKRTMEEEMVVKGNCQPPTPNKH